jgi:hypothetical protein
MPFRGVERQAAGMQPGSPNYRMRKVPICTETGGVAVAACTLPVLRTVRLLGPHSS